MLLEVLGTARDLGRLNDVASVLVRHGLGDLVQRWGIAGLLQRAGRAVHLSAAEHFTPRSTPERMRAALEDLGPTYVKLGQLLAGRPDLLPSEWTEELTRLQEEVREVPWEEVHAQLTEDLGRPPEEVFAALEATPYDKVKVLVLGQDPYHGEGQGHGLCFSVRPGVKIPPSLRNIYKEMHAELGTPIPDNGYLMPWAEQGVLLLNAVLTVRAGEANSHKGKGWELLLHDAHVDVAKLVGANRQYLEAEIPYLDRLFRHDPHAVVEGSEVIVIANAHPSYRDVPKWMREGQTLVDLVRLVERRDVTRGEYVGLAW